MSCTSAAGGSLIGFHPLEFAVEVGFKPKAVSKTKLESMRMSLEAKIGTTDGFHPPALTELTLEADKNLTVDATGIPTCNGGRRQSRLDIEGLEAACGPAIIGEGRIAIEAAFPENTPIRLHSKLLLVNGGVSGGTTTWYVHAYFNAPITGEVVFPVEIGKHRNGRYGTRVVVTIPKIGGGYASVLSFRLAIAKNVEGEDGKTYHPIAGRCADGNLQLQGKASFADGNFALVEIDRPCTPKG
jgi:hypothetical protein